MASFRPLTPSDRCNTWPEVLAPHGLSEGVSLGDRVPRRVPGRRSRIGVIADGVPARADCRRIRGAVFDGYADDRPADGIARRVAVMSIPKGYRDGRLRAVAPKLPDVSG